MLERMVMPADISIGHVWGKTMHEDHAWKQKCCERIQLGRYLTNANHRKTRSI